MTALRQLSIFLRMYNRPWEDSIFIEFAQIMDNTTSRRTPSRDDGLLNEKKIKSNITGILWEMDPVR